MGNNSSNPITINVNHDNLFYFTDETISGTVNLNIIEQNFEVNRIDLKLIGEVGYTTTRSTTDSTGILISEIVYHHPTFYSYVIPLLKPKGEQKRVVLDPGEYLWPFHISLPNHLPPTTNQSECYPRVRYYLEVTINKPWFKRHQWERKNITIYPYVNVLDNSQYLTPTRFDKQNKKQIRLKGTLNKSGYVPDESINITFSIENPEKVLIKCINLSLVQLARLGEETSQSRIFQITLPNMINFKNELLNQTFSMMIPSDSIPPSYQFYEGNQTNTIVDLSYMIKFEVKVKGMFTDFDVNIPFTMGTVENPSNIQNSMFNDDNSPPPKYFI